MVQPASENIETRVVRAGRDEAFLNGIVNPPVYHASTVVFPTVAAFQSARRDDHNSMSYGRFGTPTSFCLAEAIAELEGGYRTALFPSGLAAISCSLLAFVKPGDHILLSDSVYGPTRRFCDGLLTRMGVTASYYDPRIGKGVAELMRPSTKIVFVESPGSMTFEVQDVPGIAHTARAHGARVILDNTWASPLFFKPFEHGIDISIQAGTKYLVGHSDAMLGAATTTQECWQTLQNTAFDLGQCVGPDDAYLAQRGLRTLYVRLKQHERTALRLAAWLNDQPQVHRVLYPGLPTSPDHAIWKRDFLGASGLFGIVLNTYSEAKVAAMIDSLKFFSLGASWGGYESLVYPGSLAGIRSVTEADARPLIRLHAGLENPDDLIADLAQALARLDTPLSSCGTKAALDTIAPT